MIVATVVLLTAAGLQFVRVRDMTGGENHQPARPVDLKGRIPASLTGWTVRDEPLGPNERVCAARSSAR